MFALEYEYLDWYKARVLSNSEISWYELKRQFILTFSKADDDARDELYRVT